MAQEITIIEATRFNHPINALGWNRNSNSPIPRSMLVYSTGAADVAVPAAGKSQLAQITCSLPISYAYVLSHLSLVVWGADIADWDAEAYGSIQNSQDTEIVDLGMSNAGITSGTGALSGRVYHFPHAMIPSKPVFALLVGSKVKMHVGNTTIDGSAMEIRLTAHVWQYDFDQSYSPAIQTPVLVR